MRILLTKSKPRKNKTATKADSLILCECGFGIVLVPDLKAMSKAIGDHAAEHAKKEKNVGKAVFVEERIQNLLIVQALDKATKF
jgi:hypothetical protein